jgi:hypothetical protein
LPTFHVALALVLILFLTLSAALEKKQGVY